LGKKEEDNENVTEQQGWPLLMCTDVLGK